MAKTMQDQMLDLVEQYRREGNEWPATKRMIAEWAVANGHYELAHSTSVNACITDLASVLANEEVTDKQGRRVRRFIAAMKMAVDEEGKVSQQWLWDDIRTAGHDHVVSGFRLRRNQARNDVRKLQIELDSYNENLLPEGYERIELSFNFEEEDDDEAVAEAI